MKNITLKGRPSFQPVLAPLGGCVHRWRIDEPNGPLSNGYCQSCGKTRNDFKNGSEDYIETDFRNGFTPR